MNLLHTKIFLANFHSHKSLIVEVFLYLTVGLLGTVVDFGVFFWLNNLGFTLLIAQWAASLSGFLHNHLWQHFFVFKHHETFFRTTFLSLVFSLISIAASGPILLLLQKNYNNFILNKTIVLGITTIILFGLRKFYVFKHR